MPDETALPIDMITPETARKLLDASIAQRIGANWQDESSGWQVVTGHDFMARLNKGRVNLDFYVDLLGNVTVEEGEINAAQASGPLFAGVLLVLALGILYGFAHAVGWL